MCGLVKRVRKSAHLDDETSEPQPSRSDDTSGISAECGQQHLSANNLQSTTFTRNMHQTEKPAAGGVAYDWNGSLWSGTEDTVLYARRQLDVVTSTMSQMLPVPAQVTSLPMFTSSPMRDVFMAEASTSSAAMSGYAPCNDVPMGDDAAVYCDDVEMRDDSNATGIMPTLENMTSNAAGGTSCDTTPEVKATRKQIRQYVASQTGAGCQCPEVEKFVAGAVRKVTSKGKKKPRQKKENVLRKIASRSTSQFKRRVLGGSRNRGAASSKKHQSGKAPSPSKTQLDTSVMTANTRKRNIDDVTRDEAANLSQSSDVIAAKVVTSSPATTNTLDMNNNSSCCNGQPDRSILVKKRLAGSVKKRVRFA